MAVRLIHIDPFLRSVTEIKVRGRLEDYQALVGGDIELCIRLAPGVECWGNENGAYLDQRAYWTLQNCASDAPPVIVGKAFVAGVRKLKSGEEDLGSVPAKYSLDMIRHIVRFLDVETARVCWAAREQARREDYERQSKEMEAAGIHAMWIPSAFPEDADK